MISPIRRLRSIFEQHLWLRRGVLCVLVGLVVWIAVAMVLFIQIGLEADDVAGDARALRRDFDLQSALVGETTDELRDLRSQLRSIESTVSSPAMIPLRILPGLDRQVESASAISGAGVEVTDIGIEVLESLRERLDGSVPAGSERIELLDDLIEDTDEASSAIAALPLGPDDGLLESLTNARESAVDGISDIEDFLDDASAVMTSFRSLLDGGDSLLLVSNNAEMRAGSGMFLQIGTLETDAGRMSISDLSPAKDVILPEGAVDAGSVTYDDLWGFLRPSEEWRNLAASPRFDVTAELATRMWEGLGHPRPSEVIAVDPYLLAAVLRATGPIELDGQTIDADGVVELLLHDQYDVFEDLTREEVESTQQDRRDQLGRIADATVAALESQPVDPSVLIRGLREAVAGRHVLAWSSDATVQDGWRAAGVAGEMSPDSLMIAMLNRGANKLDPFLRMNAELRSEADADGVVHVTVDLEVRNRVGRGEVRYVAGPSLGVEGITAYGQYAGYLTVLVPAGSTNVSIDGVDGYAVAAEDGPVFDLASRVVIDPRTTASYQVRFDLPAGADTIRLEPTARPEPVRWRVGDRFFGDGTARRIDISPGAG